MNAFSTQRLELSAANGSRMTAVLNTPRGRFHGHALFAHRLSSTEDLAKAQTLSASLADAGIAVLSFDPFETSTDEEILPVHDLSSATSAILSATDFLRINYQAPVFVIGHSLAGTATLAAAHQIPELIAIAVIGAPSGIARDIHHLNADPLATETMSAAATPSDGNAPPYPRQLALDTHGQMSLKSVSTMRTSLLVLHSPRDEIVGIEHARKIFTSAKHPKSFISLGEADHFLKVPRDVLAAGRLIVGWLSQFFDLHDRQAIQPFQHITVKETGLGKYQAFAQIRGHQLLADEPHELGGLDTGPPPYDLLSAALGACTSMTLRQYADFKKISLGRVSVRVAHAKVPVRDCQECTETERAHGGRIDRFEREISIEGDVSNELRSKIMEIADKCPVHRTLERAAKVVTTVL